MGKPKAPKPPDPRETSAAQTGTGVATAISNAFLQNPNQITPDGSLTYDISKEGGYTHRDPFTGKSYLIPKVTATQTLSPEQQAIKAQSDAAELNLSTLANDQSAFLNDYMAEPFSYDPGQHEKWAMSLYDSINGQSQGRDQDALMTRLANSGITAGSTAYDDAMGSLLDSQGRSRNRFLLDSYNTGIQTAQTERNQPINEITALLSGSQVSQPNFVNSNIAGIPTTDNAGLIGENYRQRMNNYNQQMAQRQSLLGGLFGAAGSIGSAGIGAGWFS